ncbi:MAG: hypothetical protein ACPG8W_19235 [Candidatus Promineifilaceae bacterium]
MNAKNCLQHILSQPAQADTFAQTYLGLSDPDAVRTMQSLSVAIEQSLATTADMAATLRLALMLTTLRSRNNKMSHALVGVLLEYGFISTERAIQSANSHSADSFKSAAFVNIAPYLNETEAAQALTKTSKIGQESFRLTAEAHLAARLHEPERTERATALWAHRR